MLTSNTVTPSKQAPYPFTFDKVEPSCLELPLSPFTLIYDNVEPSCLESPPSPSTTTSINEKRGNLVMSPSTSTSNSYNDIEPTNFQPQRPSFPVDPTNVKAHDLNYLPVHRYQNDISISPPLYNLHPSSSPTSNFEEISNSCWISIRQITSLSPSTFSN